jgi:undecaprenyl-diphosphatase
VLAATEVPPQPAAELGVDDAVILGIVEGVTEFLPISSTGHLIVANQLLGLESDTPLTDKAGNPLWYKKPSEKHPAGVPLTIKLAANTYAVVIQVGAISAVIFLYWQQLFMMLGGLLGRSSAGLRLLRNVCYAVLPAAVIGLLSREVGMPRKSNTHSCELNGRSAWRRGPWSVMRASPKRNSSTSSCRAN